MEYQNFINIIQTELSKAYSDTAVISVDHSLRNNNVTFDTITIRNPSYNIAPTIHITPYYSRFMDGVSINDIIEDIKKTYELSSPTEDFDVSRFTNYEEAKNSIGMRLINTERNYRLLEDLPHVNMLDLSIVFVYLLPDCCEMNASILIHNNHAKLWGVDASELFHQAKINAGRLLPFTFDPIERLIQEALPVELMDETFSQVNLYCLSNKTRNYGASALAYEGLLETISEMLDSDLTIIPSSVHEILIVPESNPDYAQLMYMIHEVNDLELTESEILSDHPYFYHKNTKELCM